MTCRSLHPFIRVGARDLALWFGLFLAPAAGSLLAQPAETAGIAPLTNVVQIRQLSPAEAAAALPVRLRGVVLTPADPRDRALFLVDGEAGIYLRSDRSILAPFHRGDLIEIVGVTDPGQFAPIVRTTAARKVGTQSIPPPRQVRYYELLTGSMDGQWIEFDGVVRKVLQTGTNSPIRRLLVAADGGVVPVRVLAPIGPEIQEDAEIRVRALCLYQFNQRRQVLTPVLQVPESLLPQIIKPAPANPFEAPIRLADSLMQFSPQTPTGHRVHVRGVVLYAQSGAVVWIRDPSSGLRVQGRQEGVLEAGDEVDVLGFPAYGSFSATLEDAIFRKTGATQEPAPVILTNASEAFEHEDDLIQLEATLTDVQPVLEGLSLTFRVGETIFKASLTLPSTEPIPSGWLPGSKVRVTGICLLIHDEVRPLMGVWQPQAFQLLIRSPADLVILTAPPWWSTKRLTYALAIASAILLVATGLIVLTTQRRLNEQAHRRAMAEAEFSAILTERNRVAREIHDSLAQGLAATSVHLRLAKKQPEGDTASVNHHLDVAQQLVRESLEEARNSIWNKRSQILETADLPAALRGILKQMVDGSEMKGEVEVTGRPRRLAPVMENNLLRVGQEAITNAIRHARAGHLKLTLDFGEKHFRLVMRDDGVGFDPATPPKSAGGFGLVGMQARAAEMNGELQIQSAPGRGTQIIFSAPLVGN